MSFTFLWNNIYYSIVLFGVFVYLFIRHTFGYWKRKNVFSPPKSSFLGHFHISGSSIMIQLSEIHHKYNNQPFVGLYIAVIKLLMVRDLDLVRNVLSKDYSHFEGHGMKAHKDVDPLARHLFNLEGEEWKRIRVKLTPTFTASKMKYMFNTVLKCDQEMVEYIRDEIRINNIVDVKDITAKLSINVIASCAFGLESNCFKNPNAEFRKNGLKFFDVNSFQAMFWAFSMFAPKLAETSRIRLTHKDVEVFMLKTVAETIEYRKKNNVQRNDFLQLLIDMKNDDKNTGNQLTLKELTAQVFVFFIAGYETSSTAAHYALLELAKNPEIRDELTAQIDNAIEDNNNEITYDLLQNITLLNETIDETLRMYPPVPFLTRRCTKNYKIPDTDVLIEEGTGVAISVLGIHNDPETYPEPKKFKPERFNAENKKNRHPYAYLPFGEGPRNCIGARFGVMQLKLVLVHILKYFNVELSEKTQVNVKFSSRSILLHSEGGIYLKLTPRE